MRLLQVEKPLRRRLRRLGVGRELTQMRFDQPAEVGQMGELALAPQEQPAQLLFELLDRAGQRRLRDMALLGRPREIQGVGDRQEIADLMHLHAPTVPRLCAPHKTNPRELGVER